jgi:hypothetical protein
LYALDVPIHCHFVAVAGAVRADDVDGAAAVVDAGVDTGGVAAVGARHRRRQQPDYKNRDDEQLILEPLHGALLIRYAVEPAHSIAEAPLRKRLMSAS